jgi:hypothetical protein
MSCKLTNEQFIEKATKTHGDKYDYSLVKYVDAKTKVIIICKIHGEFSTLPSNHSSPKDKRACPKCAIKKNSNKQRFTLEQFIEKAKKTHGNKYDYSLVKYENVDTTVMIICKIHDEKFEQTPYIHINLGCGCKKCGIKTRTDKQRFTKEQFIEKAKKTHGDNYDYSFVEYVNDSTKVIIICKIHGQFNQSPNNHYKKGCRNCGIESSANSKIKYKNTEQFIEKAKKIHGNIYDYSKVDYKNLSTKIIIVCNKHKDFEQLPSGHLYGYGCQKCRTDIIRHTPEQFIDESKKIHGDIYDYSKVVYETQIIPVIISCKIHGDFYKRPKNHIHGKAGCPNCSNKKSENLSREILEEYTGLKFPTVRPEFLKNIKTGRNLELDGYCEDLKLGFEYQGKQHYEHIFFFHKKEEDFKKLQNRDLLKIELCKNYDIDVIIIPYTLDYQNENDLRYFIKEKLQLLIHCECLLF